LRLSGRMIDKQAEEVGLGGAIRNFYAYYGVFEGRSTRSEYWYSWLYGFLLSLGLVILTFIPSQEAQLTGIAAFWIIGVGHIVPSLAIQTRRLRDAGFSPFLIFIALVPFGGIALFVMAFFESKPPQAGVAQAPLASSGGMEEELRRLDELHSQGLIDDQQVKEAKNKALGI
jgi:uncharacterized membrane protein YhaH (DUF805 family)